MCKTTSVCGNNREWIKSWDPTWKKTLTLDQHLVQQETHQEPKRFKLNTLGIKTRSMKWTWQKNKVQFIEHKSLSRRLKSLYGNHSRNCVIFIQHFWTSRHLVLHEWHISVQDINSNRSAVGLYWIKKSILKFDVQFVEN